MKSVKFVKRLLSVTSVILAMILFIPATLTTSDSATPEGSFPDSSSALPPRGHNGIAANYIGDEGIGNDPDVIIAENFENYQTVGGLLSLWSVTNQDHLSINTQSVNTVTGTRSLQLNLPAQNIERHTGISLELEQAQQQDTVFVRYYQKFDENYAVPLGVSNHNGTAVSSKYWTSGPEHMGPGKAADGTNKFLVEFESAASSSKGDYTMHTYVYHPEQRYNYDDRVPIPGMSGKDPGEPWTPEYTHRPGEQYADTFFPDGEVQPWNYWRGNYGDDFISRPKFFIELDRWYCYELMIKTNTPGKKDGRITGWVDGEVILDFPNMRFRDIADLKIDLIGFSFGSASTPAATSSWFDNIVIAKSYIGPVYDGSPVDPIPAEKDGVKVKLMAFDARSDRNNPVFKSAPVTITGNGTYTATVNTVGYQDFAGLALMTTDTKFEYYCNTDFSGATKAPPDWQDSTLTFDEIKINGVAVGNNRGTTPLVTEGHISAKLWDGWSASHRRLTGVNIIDTGTNHSSVCFAVEGVPLINRIEVTFTVGGLPEPLPTFVLDVVDFEGREVITICNTTPAARSVKCYYIYYLDDEDTVKHQLLSYIIESGDFIVIRGDDITPVLKRAKVNFDISSVDLLWLYDAYGEEISRWERV